MYHRNYVRGFTWAWMALRARNSSPSGLATLNPHSTCHGPWPGPKLAEGVWAGSVRTTEPRARGTTSGRKRKKCRRAKNPHIYIYKDRAAPPIGGPALHHSGVKTVQRREREGHDSYQEVEVNIYICVCAKYLVEMLALLWNG